MIKLHIFQSKIDTKAYIQRLVDMMQLKNGQIVIKVQKGKFIHLHLQPSFKPDELNEIDKNN